MLLRPLPYASGDRLVESRQQSPKIGVANQGVSVKEIADYGAQTAALDAVVENHQMSFNMLGRGEASRVQTGVVSASFFRVALGAPRSSVVRMIVRQGLAPVAIGLACGLGGALLLTRASTRLLFAVEPTDPHTYAAVIATLAAVAALSCLAPARRAAAIDPMRALRAD